MTIPVHVLRNPVLLPAEKLLYAEIKNLCNQKGYCWASNHYLAELCHASVSSISRWVAQLIDQQLIIASYRPVKGAAASSQRRVLQLIDAKSASHACTAPLLIDAKVNNKREITKEKGELLRLGEMKNVELSKEEYAAVIALCGQVFAGILIEDLSYHIASRGDPYRSHYATILSWYRKRISERPKKAPDWYYDTRLKSNEEEI